MTTTANGKISTLRVPLQDLNQYHPLLAIHHNGPITTLDNPQEAAKKIFDQLKEQEEELQDIPEGFQILEKYPANPENWHFYIQREQWLEAYNKREFWASLPGGAQYLVSRQGLQTLEVLSTEFLAWIQSQPQVLSLRSLTLSQRKITRIPSEIGLLTRLEILEINQMPIRSLPPQIGALIQLRQFSLHHTRVRFLPTEFQSLTRLQQIGLWHNELENIDPLGSLSNLVNLSASVNKIRSLPFQLQWRQLQTLDLSDNRIEELPNSFYQSVALISVILRKNHIRSISERIAQLQLLQTLCLNENRIEFLPSSIAQLPRLTSLSVSQNQLTYLPEELKIMSALQEVCIKDNLIAARPSFLSDKVWTDIRA